MESDNHYIYSDLFEEPILDFQQIYQNLEISEPLNSFGLPAQGDICVLETLCNNDNINCVYSFRTESFGQTSDNTLISHIWCHEGATEISVVGVSPNQFERVYLSFKDCEIVEGVYNEEHKIVEFPDFTLDHPLFLPAFSIIIETQHIDEIDFEEFQVEYYQIDLDADNRALYFGNVVLTKIPSLEKYLITTIL